MGRADTLRGRDFAIPQTHEMLMMLEQRFVCACLLVVPFGCFSPNVADDETGEDDGDSSSGAESDSTGGPVDDTQGDESESAGDEAESEGDPGDTCGNAEVDAEEVCDDGINDGRYGGCMPGCTELAPRCGDGEVQEDEGEVCDDGNTEDDETCPASCGLPGGTVIWEDVYNPESTGEWSGDMAFALRALPDGGFAVGGMLHGTTQWGYPAHEMQRGGMGWLRRYSATGTTLWNETFDLAGGDEEAGKDAVVALAFDGERLYASLQSFAAPDGAVRAHELDDGGVNFERETPAYGLDALPEGGFVAASRSAEHVVRAYDGNGTPLWVDSLRATHDFCVDIATSAEGSIYAICADGMHAWDQDGIVLLKLAADGELMWSDDLAHLDRAKAVEATADGGVVIAAESEYILSISKYDAEGGLEWTYSDERGQYARALAIAPDGHIVWGSWMIDPEYMYYGVIGKLDPDGEPVWSVTSQEHGLRAHCVADVDVAEDGSVLAAGWTASDDDASSPAAWVARLSP